MNHAPEEEMKIDDAKVHEFFFVRHGQTDANLQNLICGGKWDIELNAHGRAQAEKAAQCLRSAVPGLKAICSSPLRRARATAELIAAQYGSPRSLNLHDLQIKIIDELSEWDMGEWDRRDYHEVKADFHSTREPVGGESRTEFKDRIARALEKCLKEAGPLLIVAHGEVWNSMQDLLQVPRVYIENCAPHRISKGVDPTAKPALATWQIARL
jgi:broad specificity phosphatase PhoE